MYMLAILPTLGCSHYKGWEIGRVIQKHGAPDHTYKVPGGEGLRGYDWVAYKGWIPWVEYGQGGMPRYRFSGPFCVTSLYTDQDDRVIRHRFTGALCKDVQQPEVQWVYQGTEDITARERQKEVDALFADFPEPATPKKAVFIDCGGKTALECGDAEAQARAK
jgi:hypothetical protein